MGRRRNEMKQTKGEQWIVNHGKQDEVVVVYIFVSEHLLNTDQSIRGSCDNKGQTAKWVSSTGVRCEREGGRDDPVWTTGQLLEHVALLMEIFWQATTKDSSVGNLYGTKDI